MARPRAPTVAAFALAALGVVLAVDAVLAGGLRRYVLVGVALGTAGVVPLASLWLLQDRARRWWRRLAFALVPLAALLLLLEVGVRAFAPPPPAPARLLPDARLGHVLAPGSLGTDAHGFRNPGVPATADALFVGDSQTWGFGIDADETFAARSGPGGYQLANGGYGPVQYVELVRRGAGLRPRLVVVGLYCGNDLVDAADYDGLAGAEALRLPGRTPRVRREPGFDGRRSPNLAMALVDAVLAASRVLDFAATVVKSRLRGGLLDDEPGAVHCDHPDLPTILLPGHRLPLVDPDVPAVRDGLQLTTNCLGAIGAVCRDLGARGVVLLIPTKEFCYQQWALARGASLPALEPLHAAESRLRAALVAATSAAGLELADLLPAAVAAMQAGVAVWPASGDGHLTAAGHAVAAELLRTWRR